MKTGEELLREIHDADVPPGHYAVWWFGQQGWIVKTSGCLAGIDLFLSPHPKRRYEPLLKAGEAEGFDLFLGTHDHRDHIDRVAWPVLAEASPAARFVLPARSLDEVREATGIAAARLVGVNDGMTVAAGGMTVTAVPSAHEWLDDIPEAGGHRWLGYVLDAGGEGALYHAGDTCLWEGLTERLSHWRIAAAFLPVNGRDAERFNAGVLGCMVYQEAGDLAARIGAAMVVPGHYDAFLRDELDPARLAEYVASRYPDVKTLVPRRGEMVVV